MIDLETRLLEALDWDEEQLESLYERAALILNESRVKDRISAETILVEKLRGHTTDECARLIFKILDQNIRNEMRIIEE